MNADHALIEGSSFHVASPASFRNEVEITPDRVLNPRRPKRTRDRSRGIDQNEHRMPVQSGRSRMARAAIAGAPSNTRISAPEFLSISTEYRSHISRIEGDIRNDHVGGIAKPFLSP